MPNSEKYIDILWPKSAKVFTNRFKGNNHLTFIRIDEELCFIEMRDQPLLPMLKTLHKYPDLLPHMVCDKGAIKHIFSGSNVMAPGLVSEGGSVADDCDKGSAVAIMAEGMKHAMGIGFMMQSSDEVKKNGKGMAIENIQFLNDQLWKEIK